MNIVFRTDASTEIGIGHIMRCITLAITLKRNGANIKFVTSQMPDTLANLILEQGFIHERLNYKRTEDCDELQHAAWLKSSQSVDVKATIKMVAHMEVDWVVIDHYSLDYRWQKEIRPYTKKIMVIDDIADRRHDCDVLLDQNYYADMLARYKDKVPEGCKLMIGPKFALLRNEFLVKRKNITARNGKVKRIFVNFGGVDPENYTEKTIKVLLGITSFQFEVDVVIGDQNPNKSNIKKLCNTKGLSFYVQTTKIAQLMLSADLAIGAGGATTWERCTLGLPSISIPIAKNQVSLVKHAAEIGVVYYPEIHNDFSRELAVHIEALLGNPTLISNISKLAINLVDANGVTRVSNAMHLNEIVLKLATKDYLDKLFQWRNHSEIRAVSSSKNKIDYESHKRWFEDVRNNPEKHLLIASLREKDVGVVKFDVVGDVAEISLYLTPGADLAKGIGSEILSKSEDWLAKNTNANLIKALVLQSNTLSASFFEKNEFIREHTIFTKKVKH